MYCEVLHFGFIKDGYIECPFCNEKLTDAKSVQKPCCEYSDLINDSQIVCTNCGTVNDYLTANEFVDFYENMYRIRKNPSITENIILKMYSMRHVKSMALKLVMLIGTGYIFKLIYIKCHHKSTIAVSVWSVLNSAI